MKCSHHVRLCGELLCLQTFDGHPLHRQLHPFVILNAVVLLVVYVPRHAEVSHLHCEGLIQPEKRQQLKKISSLSQFQFRILISRLKVCQEDKGQL